MTETSTDSEIDINLRDDFILNYRKLVSSLENQHSNADVPIINYHKFLIEQENFFNFGEEINHICFKLDNVKWEMSEVNQFFTALQRCGKHNPVEISRRIKTKTPLQVMMYIEQLENELQYAKEIGKIKNESLNYERIPAAREMSNKWTKFENKFAKILIQKLEESEVNHRIEINYTTDELKLQQNKSKIELFKLDMKTKDKEPPNHILCSLYDVLRDWLTIIIHDLIILNQHHKRLYPQENVKHLITVQEIRRVLRFRGYKISLKDRSSNIEVPDFSKRNNSSIFWRSLDDKNKHDDWSTDTDYIEAEEEKNNTETSGNDENHEDEEIEDIQGSDSSRRNEQDHKLDLKERIIDKLYEKALIKLLREHSTDDRVSKLRDDKLESIFYHAIIWNDYINNIKLDKALGGDLSEYISRDLLL